MKIGSRVRVVAGVDDTFDVASLGRTGIVVNLAFGEAGVGESPHDPFIRVLLDNDNQDGFWTEELICLLD